PRAAAQEVLGKADGYDEATRTGGDIAIPTERYAVTIAPSEHNTFFQDELRAAPGDMNAREAQEFVKRMDEQEQVTQAEAQPAEDPAKQIGSRVTEQLTAAGFDEQTAGSYAQIIESGFRSLGERAGVDP